jgi:hypothetical protein
MDFFITFDSQNGNPLRDILFTKQTNTDYVLKGDSSNGNSVP